MKVYAVVFTDTWDYEHYINPPLFADKAKAEERAKELEERETLCHTEPDKYFYIVEEFEVDMIPKLRERTEKEQRAWEQRCKDNEERLAEIAAMSKF